MQTFDSSHRYQSNERVEISDTPHCYALNRGSQLRNKGSGENPLPAASTELRGAFGHHSWVSNYYITFLVANRAPTQTHLSNGGLRSSGQDTTAPGWLLQRHANQSAPLADKLIACSDFSCPTNTQHLSGGKTSSSSNFLWCVT